MNMNKMALPALSVGVVLGFLNGLLHVVNNLPFLKGNLLTCINWPSNLFVCCLLPFVGGFLAAVIYSKLEKIDAPGGVFVGAFTGIISGSLSSIFGVLISFAATRVNTSDPRPVAGVEAVLYPLLKSLNPAIPALIGLFGGIIFGIVLGAVGGLFYAVLAASFSHKKHGRKKKRK